MIPLLASLISGVIYSIAGQVGGWMRTWLICPLILIAMIFTGGFSWQLAYPILLGASWSIGYGENSPVMKWLRSLGVGEFWGKVITRLINGMAISGSGIILNIFSPTLWANFLKFTPLYIYIGVFNPFKKIVIFNIDPARIEEFVIGFLSVLIPFFIIWG